MVEAEELLARIISERMRGGATPCAIAQFIALVTAERKVFRIIDVHLPELGLVLIYTDASQKITDAPGMDDWKWWYADISWTHELPPPLLARLLIAPRLRIRAFDVDWGRAAHWEHNLVRADGFRLGMMTGTPAQRWNNAWSVSEFDIPLALIKDGRVTIDVDVDSRHTQRTWVVWIDWSKIEFLRVEMRPGEVATCPHIREAAREWLRQENIGRENVGERPRIWVWRTVSRIEDGDDFFVKEPIFVGRWRQYRVRIKGIDTPEMPIPPIWPTPRYAPLIFLLERQIDLPEEFLPLYQTFLHHQNQYCHAARATSRLQGLIPRGTIVRIESYYPFGICIHPIWRTPWRIQGFAFRDRDRLDIAEAMIRGGFGVAAIRCAEGVSHWYWPIDNDRSRELQNAQQAAKGSQKGIWNPNACEERCDLRHPRDLCTLLLHDDRDRLLLHPGYYRRWRIPWWAWWLDRITLEEAIDYSRIKLSHTR